MAKRAAPTAAVVLLALLAPEDARAVRFSLGVATDLTPLALDPAVDGSGATFRFGFRPVLEVEASHYLSFGAYAPFTIYRAQTGGGAASSGAESVFGVTVSGRYPLHRLEAPEELLLYATLRGGFGTVDGRAGPFYGGALGASATWLGTGRGVFAELQASQLDIGGLSGLAPVDRFTIGISLGVVFRLGGEDWNLGPKRLEDHLSEREVTPQGS